MAYNPAELRRLALLAVLAALFLLAGCAPFSTRGDHMPVRMTPTTGTPLLNRTIYWSQNTWLTALRASDGAIGWQTGHQWAESADGNYSFAYGPLATTLADGSLYALGIDDHESAAVFAFSASDGRTQWQTPVTGCLTVPVSVPLVAAGIVYVALTGHFSGGIRCKPTGWVYALRASDGNVLWRVSFTAGDVWPKLALTNGVLVVANATDSDHVSNTILYLSGLRTSDGKQLWRISTTKYLVNFAAANGLVITSGGANTRYDSRLDVEAFRASDGARLWESVDNNSQPGSLTGIVGASAPFESSAPFLANGMVYIFGGDGSLYAMRATDGRTAWRFQTGTDVIGAPSLANGYLYVGVGPALDILDATSGALVRSYLLFDPLAASSHASYIWSTPLVTASAIFVSAGFYDCSAVPMCHLMDLDGRLYGLDGATGKILWHYQTPQGYQVTAPLLGR